MNRRKLTTTDTRRIHIAGAVAAGKSITSTAREFGISRESASRIANATETQQIIAMLANAHLEHASELFQAALAIIKEGFQARRTVVHKGQVVDAGPDHYARLAAVAALVRILTAGRPIPKPKEKKEEKGLITLDELKRLIEEQEQAAREGGEEEEG